MSMRRVLSNSWPSVLLVWLACNHADGRPSTLQPNKAPTMNTQSNRKPVDTLSDPRRLTVEHTHERHQASGAVLLRQIPVPDGGPSPHLKLAGSRAWLALGQQRLAAEDWSGAVSCARAGLEELGEHYAPRRIINDTVLHLGAAEDQLRSGNTQNAAIVMLRTLATRTRMYVELYADEIAE